MSSIVRSGNLITVATCNLNQWALDFDGNLRRTLESIEEAKRQGAVYRLGPELELCGYSCDDHFMEEDTLIHSYEVLGEILQSGATNNILCDIGLPVRHRNVRYNCRALCMDGRILALRPKTIMADNGNYRETRYFTPWRRWGTVDEHVLHPILVRATKRRQTVVPFGVVGIELGGVSFGCEICEELWAPEAMHTKHFLAGIDIIGNGSASHHELRKLNARIRTIAGGTARNGGVYLYANQRGCDGTRLYFDGCAMVVLNGNVLAQGKQFGIDEVEVVSATFDLEDIRGYRSALPSLQSQSATTGVRAYDLGPIHGDDDDDRDGDGNGRNGENGGILGIFVSR